METEQTVFGQGFGGITDPTVGTGDGYLYVLSIGAGAVYKVLPKSAAATSSVASEDMSTGAEENPFDDREKSKISQKDKQLEMEKSEQHN